MAASAGDSLVAAIAFNMLTSGAMAKIWGMINSMQVMSHLPLIAIILPNYSSPIINEILEIASFEVIPLGEIFFDPEADLYVDLFELPENDEDIIY